MTRVRFELQSPLTLLKHWEQRPDGARLRDVLVTGYTLDLAFFEQRFVSLARGLGSRVTVLSDAYQDVHDPIDVKAAGRNYQHAHVGCRGAFHPKVVVLVGDDGADDNVWVAIGSGNPTSAGWGHNDELWLDIRTNSRFGPRALVHLASWLEELASTTGPVALPSWVREIVDSLAHRVRPQAVDESLQELLILGNLSRPLFDQLPNTPATTLSLTAPFVDPTGETVRRLVSRMTPNKVVVGIQQRLGVFHGESLVASVGSTPTEYRALDEDRISHGKLIEWTKEDGTRRALIGSPNITGAALLKSTRDGGNCELAAIYPVPRTLLPDGVSLSPDTVRERSVVQPNFEPRQALPLIFLGARRRADTIEAEFVVHQDVETITIETSPTAAPGTWRAMHVVRDARPGPLTEQFVAPESGGASVKALVTYNGGSFVTPVVFLTDTAKCSPREVGSSTPRLTQQFDEVFTDPELAARFQADLLRLLAANAAMQKPSPSMGTSSQRDIRRQSMDDDRWGAWIENVESTIGLPLARGLFPGLEAALVSPRSDVEIWGVDDRNIDTDVTEDESPEDIDPIGDDVRGRQVPVVAPAQVAKLRLWCARLCKAVTVRPAPALELRMLVFQLYLDLLAAGVWGPDDTSWRKSFSEVLCALPPQDAEARVLPPKALTYVKSLVVVGLALLRQDASLHGGNEEDIRLRRVWDLLVDLVTDAEIELTANYLYQPLQQYGRTPSEAGIEAVIKLARESASDPSAPIRAALEAEGVDVELVNGIWVSEEPTRQARARAARIATIIGQYSDKCAVLVRTDRGSCAILRDGADIAMAEENSSLGAGTWWLMRLPTALSTPTSLLTGQLPRDRRPVARAARTDPLVRIARRVGADLGAIEELLN